MGATIRIYIDDETAMRLAHAAKALDRSVVDLAESLVSEGALMYAQTLPAGEDPGSEERNNHV